MPHLVIYNEVNYGITIYSLTAPTEHTKRMLESINRKYINVDDFTEEERDFITALHENPESLCLSFTDKPEIGKTLEGFCEFGFAD